LEHAAAGPLAALEASALGAFARESVWLYPAASVGHILGLALLLGAIVAFDLRVLGAARAVPLRAAAGLLLPLARLGLAIQVATGVVMLAADATHLAVNPAFRAKAALLALALINVVAFHALAGRGLAALEPAPGGVLRLSAAASLGLWAGVASLGRFIAYV
jgi:hypothetical protein